MSDWLFQELPKQMMVYPSEGYYYFHMFRAGKKIRGNIRFDERLIKKGKLPIIFLTEFANGEESEELYEVIENGRDLKIEVLAPGSYELEYKGKKISVSLYDLGADRASFAGLKQDEVYVGPLFDDSAIKFDLVYNNAANTFHYVLNERSGVNENLQMVAGLNNIAIGDRTGFAYFVETDGRKILIGARKNNVYSNTHYDGPFDQLPDTILDGEQIKTFLETYDKELIGKILPGGWYKDDELSRYAIVPYIGYEDETELYKIAICGLQGSGYELYKCLGNVRLN